MTENSTTFDVINQPSVTCILVTKSTDRMPEAAVSADHYTAISYAFASSVLITMIPDSTVSNRADCRGNLLSGEPS
ncbi:hypothetical protein TNCT_311131 [Trichonephila clavata]|uniref:Uncharacterized protein n=1 Tax=Trichonephila clavata TaxID=2740835 RepID=A0A8X6I2F4_TRICU|nr:hypothetical protein TNCT_311131 [Trichonephila clavata]